MKISKPQKHRWQSVDLKHVEKPSHAAKDEYSLHEIVEAFRVFGRAFAGLRRQ
ncbi:hypothetical protein [Bifidobacterium aquikefiri]|uniref:hypothetical protein n=1 Tax=Bifidobacterium aquikefiri TaxID=1653207 RepID=UPI0039E78E91